MRSMEGRTAHRHLWSRLMLVLAILVAPLLTPLVPVASASGFECKEVPQPQFPNDVFETNFDASAIDGPSSDSSGTGYDTYGWAGLDWSTYDLGCGEDLLLAPDAVADTRLGNLFTGIGKSLAAAAFWLDEQTSTGADGTIGNALSNFDRIVTSVVQGMVGIYGMWLGVGLMIAASIILWRALRADAAGVTRAVAIASAGLALGALMVGAPQAAIGVADETFGAVITDTQEAMLSANAAGPGGGAGAAAGPTDPRDVLLDRIYLPDWRKGWFGTNYDKSDEAGLGPKLRDSLAFSYDEQRRVADDSEGQSDLAEDKAEQFKSVVSSLEEEHGLSYFQFQGKDSGRASTGFIAMLKLSLPSVLWIGASVLKLIALLVIRFAILFAPLWVPLAMVHGPLLSRVLKTIASAYMWGVAGTVIVAAYLMVVVRLYSDDSSVDSTWRLWLMIALSVVCWVLMRPFKRLTQTITQNNAGLLNRSAQGAKKAMRQKLFQGAAAATGVGAVGAAVAGKAAERFGGRGGREDLDDEGTSKTLTPVRPEGRGLDNLRRQSAADSRRGPSRADRMASESARDRDARVAGIAAAAGRDLATGAVSMRKGGSADEADSIEAAAAVRAGTSAWRMLDKAESEDKRAQRQARREMTTVGRRWDGGAGAAIAPMQVYTPSTARTAGGWTTPAVVSTRKPDRQLETAQRLWEATRTGAHRAADDAGDDIDRSDRYS